MELRPRAAATPSPRSRFRNRIRRQLDLQLHHRRNHTLRHNQYRVANVHHLRSVELYMGTFAVLLLSGNGPQDHGGDRQSVRQGREDRVPHG